MVDPNKILKFLEKKKINFFTGVPDSTLKNFTLLFIIIIIKLYFNKINTINPFFY